MKIGVVLFVFALCIAGAILADFVWATPPIHIANGLDSSPSVARDCSGLLKSSQALVSEQGIQEGSTLTLLGIGHSRINPEPKRLFDRAVPLESDAVFGRNDGEFEHQRNEFFVEIRKACEAAVDSKDSPLLALVQRGIAHLRSRGCAPEGECFYVIQSDLEDDSAPPLRTAFQRAAKDPKVALPPELAASIDNAGVRIEFCGTSQVRPRRSGKHASPETLARLWAGMFTKPELVSFKPYCGQ